MAEQPRVVGAPLEQFVGNHGNDQGEQPGGAAFFGPTPERDSQQQRVTKGCEIENGEQAVVHGLRISGRVISLIKRHL